MTSEAYLSQIKDPRWQKRRLQILERDNWACSVCSDTTVTLHVHHKIYLSNKLIWDYPDNLLVTLCESCHQLEYEFRTEYEQKLILELRKYLHYFQLAHLVRALSRIPNNNAARVIDYFGTILNNTKIQKLVLDECNRPLSKDEVDRFVKEVNYAKSHN